MTSMKCHYEVLGVPRDSSTDDMKKAYRKLALKWHPDKNLEDAEKATQLFRLVQQAYEVLSDPQERAWYDKHREAILRGGMGRGDQYQDESLNVFQYFNSSCYKGFGDDKEGFYAVYDEVFKTLAEEDRQFKDEDHFVVYEFGNSASVFEEVVKQFYDYWEHYCTAKSFVWMEKYDLREAPDRRVRRLMEAENKKLRDMAKKQRNEEVRALAKFVKKRDRRFQQYKIGLEKRADEIAQKAKQQRKRHLEESRKKLENYTETEWSSAVMLEDNYKLLEASYDQQFGNGSFGESMEDNAEEEEEEDLNDDFFCVACNKAFKSDKAFINHEKSKKHREMVAIIKANMNEEELDQTRESEGGCEVFGVLDIEDVEEGHHLVAQRLSKKQKKKRKQQRNQIKFGDEMEELGEAIGKTEIEDLDNEDTSRYNTSKKDQQKDRKNKQPADYSDVEDEAVKTCLDKVISNTSEGRRSGENSDDFETSDRCPGVEDNSDNKAARESTISPCLLETQTNSDPQTENKKRQKNQADPNQKQGQCGICGAVYTSRSKLFDHIKAAGHAMRKDVPELQQKLGKKNKNRKGK